MRINLRISCLFILLTSYSAVGAQPAIQGPQCVLPGVVYQYTIRANWDASFTTKVCVTGGSLVDIADSCVADTTIPEVRVIWDTSNHGFIRLTLPSGDTVIQVMVTQALSAGIIDSLSLTQFLDSLTIPSTITSSDASGGGCSSSYVYQWQKSLDNIDWEDVVDHNTAAFVFSAPIQQSTYYRRKVIDNGSGTVAYSTTAAVFINHQ